jgi:hypothetical protein
VAERVIEGLVQIVEFYPSSGWGFSLTVDNPDSRRVRIDGATVRIDGQESTAAVALAKLAGSFKTGAGRIRVKLSGDFGDYSVCRTAEFFFPRE